MTARRDEGRPRLARGARLHHDRVRARWVLLAPERVIAPDPHALAVLQRLDGRSVAALVDDLVDAFGGEERAAAREVIARDVEELLAELDALGVLDWASPEPSAQDRGSQDRGAP